jgi:hypothetical protein
VAASCINMEWFSKVSEISTVRAVYSTVAPPLALHFDHSYYVFYMIVIINSRYSPEQY